MNILIIGSGGREHALAWKIKQSPHCEALYIAPGNGGTKELGENVVVDIKNNQAIVDFVKEKDIGLVVVGPDDYLAQGVVDAVLAAGIPAFGASQAASRLEWSKAFAKEFMKSYGIPTAQSETFTSHDEAVRYIEDHPLPIVIKADGLALGKGVVIANTYDEAFATLRSFMLDAKFGESGKTVVIEEFLKGTEVSLHAFCDGKSAKLFPVARDHKRVNDNNTGANTGGMGTIAPIPVTEDFLKDVLENVVMPVIDGMKGKGQPFSGILFPGLMVLSDGSYRVLEFNARFGDPECESYMRLLESDIVEIMLSCVEQSLASQEIVWSKKSVVTVILASGGYPDSYEKGFPISGIAGAESDADVVVFHAGTTSTDGHIVTAGGRVLAVSAVGDKQEIAREKAYRAVEKITFNGKQNRADIGAYWGL